jgi:hypothetical protein
MHGAGSAGRGGHTAFMSYSDEHASQSKCIHISYLPLVHTTMLD